MVEKKVHELFFLILVGMQEALLHPIFYVSGMLRLKG